MSATTVTLAGYNITKPSTGPTLAAGTVSGLLTVGATYYYRVTFVTPFGETDGNTTSSSFVVTSTGSVNLTAIATSSSPHVYQRKVYRSAANVSTAWSLLTTIADNTTTTYTDIIADGSLGAAIPTVNTASSREVVRGHFGATDLPQLYSVTDTITAFAGGGQASATQLVSQYNILTTVATAADSVKLPQLTSDLIGLFVSVVNNGANSTNVFPATGQDAGAGTNTAVAVAAASRGDFVAVSATAWKRIRTST